VSSSRRSSVGQRSVTNESFGGEWRSLQGSGESVEVVTPFPPASRWPPVTPPSKNEPLKPQDQEKMLTS